MTAGFKFDAVTLGRIAVWGVAFPVFIFNMAKNDTNAADDAYGRKKREFV